MPTKEDTTDQPRDFRETVTLGLVLRCRQVVLGELTHALEEFGIQVLARHEGVGHIKFIIIAKHDLAARDRRLQELQDQLLKLGVRPGKPPEEVDRDGIR